jgi:O-antigen ligase
MAEINQDSKGSDENVDVSDGLLNVAKWRSSKRRAWLSGTFLAILALVWVVLSFIFAIRWALTKVCAQYSTFHGRCIEESNPYVEWAITGLLVNLMIAVLLFSIGTYVQARMREPEKGD